MKLFTATFFTLILFSLHAAMAQDAASVPIPDNGASASPTPSPLFPTENPPPIVGKPQRGGGGGTDRGAARGPLANPAKPAEPAMNVEDNIKYRQAKTKALRDEKIQEVLASVDTVKTDPEKRAQLKQYYTLLAAKILKIDGSIKKLVATRLQESLNQLDQHKVRPEEYPEQASTSH
jgi:hypothetical protein